MPVDAEIFKILPFTVRINEIEEILKILNFWQGSYKI